MPANALVTVSGGTLGFGTLSNSFVISALNGAGPKGLITTSGASTYDLKVNGTGDQSFGARSRESAPLLHPMAAAARNTSEGSFTGRAKRSMTLSGTSGSITVGSLGITFNNSSSGTLSLRDGNNTTNTIAGSILPSTSGGAVQVIKRDDASTWVFSNANIYTGNTTIIAGTLTVGYDSPLGGPGALGSSTSAVNLANTTTTDGTFVSAALMTNGPYLVGQNVQAGVGAASALGRPTSLVRYTAV